MDALLVFVAAALMAGSLFWLGTLVGGVRLRGGQRPHGHRPKPQRSPAAPAKRVPIPTVVLEQLRSEEGAPVSAR